MNTITTTGYDQLQTHMEQLLGQIGLENTIVLLDSFIHATAMPLRAAQQATLVRQYLVMECILVFGLDKKLFFTSNIQEYREARMACYHLLKKYTGASFSKIAEDFGLTKRNVLYGCGKCEERLELPYYYKTFKGQYATLEKGVKDFISKLNDSHDQDCQRSSGNP